MLTPKHFQRRVTRAEYDMAKANCSAKINLQMAKLNLSPAQLQAKSVELIISGQQKAGISMQDLNQYRYGRCLPKDLKLQALAALLQCHPDDLVPKHMQSGRVLVQRQSRRPLKQRNLRVTAVEGNPGESLLEVYIHLPTDQAHKVAGVLARYSSTWETMKATGLSAPEAERYNEEAKEQFRLEREGRPATPEEVAQHKGQQQ